MPHVSGCERERESEGYRVRAVRSRGRQLCNFEYGPVTIDRGSAGHAQSLAAGQVSWVMAGTGDTSREAFNFRLDILVNSKGGNCRLLTKEKYTLLIEQVKAASTKKKKEAVDYRRLNRYNVASVGGEERLIVPRTNNQSPILHYVYEDEVFDILEETHLSLLHGGRTRMLKKIQSRYKNITREIVEIYLSLCMTCRATRGDAFSSLQFVEIPGKLTGNSECFEDRNVLTFFKQNSKSFVLGQEEVDSFNDASNLESSALMNVECTISEVPQTGGGGQVGQSPGGGSPGPAPVPAVKKVVAAPPPAPAAPPEVCLRWNSYHSNMQATFPSLLNNEQFVDVTLACEGRSIKCHKVMLSACSSYFEELLSQNPCQHPIIFMRDLKFWEVQALVEFMYTGEVNVAQDKLPSLLTAAEALQIKGLTNPGGGGGGGSTGSYAASQEDDSNTTPDIDDVSSPSYCPPAKKIRKRKATNPTSYHQKAQAVYSPVTQQGSPISSPMLHQVAAPPALTPMRMMSQPNIGMPQIASHATSQSAPAAHSTSQPPVAHPGTLTATVQSRPSQPRIKKEPGSPPHSYLAPPHPPFTHVIKSEPDDNMDTLLDLSESESRKECNAVQPPEEPLSLATNDQGPSSNGSQSKAQDNGLSEEETGSDCSESQSMHIDPGETSDA